METVEYDRYGRLKYNPKYHRNTGKPWKSKDLKYLIEYYDKIGGSEMSYALERTEQSIRQMVNVLRKTGKMAQAKRYKKRTA